MQETRCTGRIGRYNTFMAKLTILTGPLRRQAFELDPKDQPKIIGRTRDKAHFFLPDPAVSRQHAELFFRDGQWLICDLNSSNGTFLNEQRITRPVQLHSQDQIRCGGTVLLLKPASRLPPVRPRDWPTTSALSWFLTRGKLWLPLPSIPFRASRPPPAGSACSKPPRPR
ncbi:MAG TPA: FHA domain-containing protein [Anaerohalosphaeraceae bacterium]|nr:FHA domain-containing protein [Anaerohalosphaeraceae bacterium]